MEWITTFLASALAVTVVSLGFEFWRENRLRNESVRHLALRIAFYLEGFAIECANMLNDHRYAGNEDGRGKYLNSVPQPSALPESSAYTLIKSEILEEILDFPQRCQMADRDVAGSWKEVNYEVEADNAHAMAEKNMKKIGEHAVRLAEKIRNEYNLPKRDLTFGNWDVGAFFGEELKIVREREG